MITTSLGQRLDDPTRLHDVLESATKARDASVAFAVGLEEPSGLFLRAPVRDAAAADKAMAKQEAAVVRAEAKAVEAEQLLETRRGEVRRARAELDDLSDRRDAAASEVGRAKSALDTAEQALPR